MGNDNGNELRADKREESGNQIEGLQRPEHSVYRARRLTPTECARLQGFPPDWCADVPHSDSAEYKLWGNGIGLPCIIPMMDAMGKEIRKEEGCTHHGTF